MFPASVVYLNGMVMVMVPPRLDDEIQGCRFDYFLWRDDDDCRVYLGVVLSYIHGTAAWFDMMFVGRERRLGHFSCA